jgi:AcrR family transcriptional regulator
MKEQRRKTIRAAAAKLFAQKGYENTTTRDIARAANISSAAVYYYFDSKEDLLYQILDETITNGLELLSKIAKGEKTLPEKLSSILQAHTRTAVDYNKMKLLVHDQRSLSSKHKEFISKKQRDYVQFLIRILEELKREGKIVDIDTTVCAFAFFGMVSWAYRWYNPKGRIKPAELANVFNQIFTQGIFLAPKGELPVNCQEELLNSHNTQP